MAVTIRSLLLVFMCTALTVIASDAAMAQGWKIYQGKDNRGVSYATGIVRNGFAELSVRCFSDDMSGIVVHLVELPMPQKDKVQDKELTFTLAMDQGGGLMRKVPVEAYYYDGEDTWIGKMPYLTINEFGSFAMAKRFQILRADGSVIITFSAKGSRKVEEAMQSRCNT